jgi:succinate-semialdehyde dehydrogenase/glutarate-semialdehyde dehydrogenase
MFKNERIGGEKMSYDDRFEKVRKLAEVLEKDRDRLVEVAVRNLRFTVRDSRKEVDITVDRLHMYEQTRAFLENRVPLGGEGSRVYLMLSYNGSAWLNTAITSIFMVGNRVVVKFASRGSDVMKVTEEMYSPIFGDHITFYGGSGKFFIREALKDPMCTAVVVFGFDENVKPYEPLFRESGKKLVFEGPGQDPFIVFPDADIDLALSDLMVAKFMYSGQICTAPKRIFIHRSIYDGFLEMFVERVNKLVVGDPENERTDISPVASDLALARIKMQLKDAVENGAKILTGGKIEGNLIYPTVVRDAADDMLGMREEVFGPVAFTSPFETKGEVLERAGDHKYGLRAAVFGGEDAAFVAENLKGDDYCHPVSDYTFGKFGTVALNQTRAESWRGAFVIKAVGGYGYSGWIWETVDGEFMIKQGPKLLSIETSREG